MSLRETVARWLVPDAFRTVERYHYLRRQLEEAAMWLGYEFPEVDASIRWAKVSEVNHFRGIDEPSVAAVPGRPWIWSISDFREHLRDAKKALPARHAVAREIWKRFSPSPIETWDDESHKDEYLRCADAIFSLPAENSPGSPSEASACTPATDEPPHPLEADKS